MDSLKTVISFTTEYRWYRGIREDGSGGAAPRVKPLIEVSKVYEGYQSTGLSISAVGRVLAL
jgi:hypothetical protein